MQEWLSVDDGSDVDRIEGSEAKPAEPFWCWQRLIGLGLAVLAALLVAGIALEFVFLY